MRSIQLEWCIFPWFVDCQLKSAPFGIFLAFWIAVLELLVEQLRELHFVYEWVSIFGKAQNWVYSCVTFVTLNPSADYQLSVLSIMVALLNELFQAVIFDSVWIDILELGIFLSSLCVCIKEVTLD